MSGKLFIISAPSGTGKTTLVHALLRDWSDKRHRLERVVTYTTRSARPTEIEGEDYHFISEADFKQKIEQKFFLEWVLFCGFYYGSPAFVLDPAYRKDVSYILVLDHVGGVAIKNAPGVVLIWITPPSLEELKTRLEKRGKDSAEVIEQRVKKAQEELEAERIQNAYHYHLVNEDFYRTENELKSLVEREIGTTGVGLK